MARVLVIEDNPANMDLTAVLLETAGHSVLRASDAEGGIEIARDESPDIILMDINLPGMDGLQATAILKNNPPTAGIPVIALTALAMKGDEERIRSAGCDDYLSKPLRYQDLWAAIDLQISNRRNGEIG